MGGFSSGGNPLLRAGASMVDVVAGVPVATAVLGAAETGARQKVEQQAVQEGYDQQAQTLQRQQQQQIRERQDLLRRTVAAQRARLGAMGVAAGGGSADALVAGLHQQAAVDVSDMGAEYGDRLSVLDSKRRRQREDLAQSYRQQWGRSLAPLVSIGKGLGGDWGGGLL